MSTDTESSEFARHWTLDPDVDFLNHGSFGACPRTVLAVQNELRAQMERQPVRFFARELESLQDSARHTLAGFLGADAESLAFVPNATTGVNTVLDSLSLARGDEVLTTSHEYNACRNALDRVAARAGARVITAEIPFPLRAPAQCIDALVAAVSPRTRLLLVDHVTSPTGMVLPIADIVAEMSRRGVDTLVDGAHAPGMVPLDLRTLGAAYYTGNLHKWACAPKGAAFLSVREDKHANVRPLVTSHGANSRRTDRSRFRLEFDWTGTHDPSGYLAIPAALSFLETVHPGGLDGLRAQNRALALRGRDILCEALGVAAPCPDAMIGAMAAVPLPDGPGDAADSQFAFDALQDALYARGIEVPIGMWPSPPRRLVRISAQIYNVEAQYVRLAKALRELLAAGR